MLTSLTLLRWIGHSRAPAATAFLEFTIRVCRGKRAGIMAAAVLYVAFGGFMLVWRYQTSPFPDVGEYVVSGPVLTFGVISVVLAVVGLRVYRRLGIELDSLRGMLGRFEDGE